MFKKLMLAGIVATLYGCGGGDEAPMALQQKQDAPQAVSGPNAKAMAVNTQASLNLDDIDRGTFCYAETHNFSADVSAVRSAFNGSNWLQTISGVYALRWPSGKALAEAQANDQYFKDFVNTSSFNKLAESLMVAIHEETHMWDLATSRTEWDKFTSSWITDQLQFLKFNLYTADGGFPRKEILELIKDDASSETDDIYLKAAQQGDYRLNGVTAELNASLMGLPAAAAVAEFIDGVGASNSRNLTLTNLSYLQLYLRVAKSKYPNYYNKIKADPTLRKYVVVQFLRNAYWITKSEPWAAKLGSSKVSALIQRVYAAENIAILEDFSGYKLPRSISENCMGNGGVPAISSQPAGVTVNAGQAATFSVQASGTDLKYQWRRNGADIPGATAASYTLATTTTADNGALFSVVVSNAKGSVTSSNATLTVKSPDATLPVITSQPVSVTANAGQTATFSVTATSGTAMSYQWKKNGVNISGATSASYTTPALTAADNGAQWSVVVTNSAGSVTSATATLTVKSPPDVTPPVINTQPLSATVNAGQTASFNVAASSTVAMSYQWLRNGVAITGATAASYTTPVTTTADSGAAFSVKVCNSAGCVTSSNAVLTVKAVDNGGGTTKTGTLSAGASVIFPGGTNGYYQSTGGGTFSAKLTGPSNTDFDLYLYKWNGYSWAVVAKSEGPASTESFSYKGTAGYYYLELRSYSGSGSYTLTYTLPK